MTEIYKITCDMVKAERQKFCSFCDGAKNWDHSVKQDAGRIRTEKIKYFFAQHIVKLWTELPQGGNYHISHQLGEL